MKHQIPAAIAKHLPPPSVLDQIGLLPRQSEREMVAEIGTWIDGTREKMTVEADQRMIRESIRNCLKAGTLAAMSVVAAAEKYREIDLALRQLFAEALDIPGVDLAATTTLRAYFQRMAVRDITPAQQGGAVCPEFGRDIGIACLVAVTLVCWPHLRKTRATLLVSKALNTRRIALGHSQVARIYRDLDHIAGKLARLIPDA
jgi:hypothetical protein